MAQNATKPTEKLKFDHLYQLVMIGDSGVGKTAFI